MVTDSNRGISFVIEKRLGVLSTSSNGWRKELNLVSWNERPAKLDIREWSPDHEKMAKGITLRNEEAQLLQKALYRWFTGYGKQPERSSPAAGIPQAAEVPETAVIPEEETVPFEPQDEEPVFPDCSEFEDCPVGTEYGEAMEEPFLYEPETGEILEPSEYEDTAES